MATREQDWPDLVLTRALAAPRDLVFRAFTEPARLAAWWGPRGFSSPRCEVDARPGGVIRIQMRAADGAEHGMAGTFREVQPPERLVFTAVVADDGGAPLFEVLNTVTLDERDGGTLLTLRSHVLSAVAAAAAHLRGQEAGWTQSLERLAGDLAGAADPDRALVMSRVLHAPPRAVFAALTQPEQLAAWWGPRGFTSTVQELDARPGGAWRILQHAPDGREHTFHGTYREAVPPSRLVFTQRWQAEGCLNTVTLAAHDAGTLLTLLVEFDSPDDLDAAVRHGMRQGAAESWDRLAELVGDGCEIVMTRVLPAPADLLFRLWTEPGHVARWWGPNGFSTRIQEMDVRPGGAWRFVMRGPDGSEYPNEARYVEVRAPERLVYEHLEGPWFRHEVSFRAEGRQTEVTVRMRFASAAARQEAGERFGAVEGLAQTLARLAEQVACPVA